MVKKMCCSEFKFFLDEGKVDVFLDKKTRSYFIGLKNSDAIQKIFYCPWCGNKFEDSLKEKWFEILEKEYGISDPYDEDADKVPEEFKTDEWWKKRGL